ncbi:SpoIIE family protein phosphatase [Acidobacteria bacterium AH-259-D05]|nr:SpoIIE family protein phosphatase [Acidobacteria bacterium AH-259-D05]
MTDRTEFLKTTNLLSKVPDNLITRISGMLQEIQAKTGEIIFREGDVGDAVYVVVEGSLALETNKVQVLQLRRGEWVGELALIDDAPRSASAIAKTDVLLLKWTREDFIKAVAGNTEVVRGILKMLSGKLRQDLALQVESAVRQERWRQDLKRAHEIQMAMLPEEELSTEQIEISGYCHPADDVGGDYYDYLLLGQDRLSLILADVMGHGFYAGLLVAMTKSCLHTQTRIDSSPVAVMEAMNRTVFSSVRSGLLMTCCYLVVDFQKHTLTYTNAGHPYPYHYCRSTDQLERLNSTDLLLGIPGFQDAPFTAQKRKVGQGDLLVLYSDGIPEAEDAKEKEFGEERLGQIILENKDKSAAQIKDCVMDALSRHCQGMDQSDDVTLVVAKTL